MKGGVMGWAGDVWSLQEARKSERTSERNNPKKIMLEEER
jgi:hypothetical protein